MYSGDPPTPFAYSRGVPCWSAIRSFRPAKSGPNGFKKRALTCPASHRPRDVHMELEPEAKRELESPRRLGGNRFAEKGRDEISDVAYVIHVVQGIEGIEGKGDRRSLVFSGRSEKKIARPAKTQIRVAWSLETVATHAGRPVIR